MSSARMVQPISFKLDGSGNATFDAQPLQAYWSLAIVSLTAVANTAWSYGEMSLGPLLFGDGATWQMGPLVFAPGERPRIIATGGVPGSTVKGTLWGVQGTSFEDVSQLYSTAVLNFGQGSTNVTVVNGPTSPVITREGGTFIAPISENLIGNATGPDHDVFARLHRIVVNGTATTGMDFQIGGATYAHLLVTTGEETTWEFDGLEFPAAHLAWNFFNPTGVPGTTNDLTGYYIYS